MWRLVTTESKTQKNITEPYSKTLTLKTNLTCLVGLVWVQSTSVKMELLLRLIWANIKPSKIRSPLMMINCLKSGTLTCLWKERLTLSLKLCRVRWSRRLQPPNKLAGYFQALHLIDLRPLLTLSRSPIPWTMIALLEQQSNKITKKVWCPDKTKLYSFSRNFSKSKYITFVNLFCLALTWLTPVFRKIFLTQRLE